jgi:hypothetical protein
MTKLCPRCLGNKGYGDIVTGWTPCERCDGAGRVPGTYFVERHCLIHSSTSTTVTDHLCTHWQAQPNGSSRIIPVLGDEYSIALETAFDGIHKAFRNWPDDWKPFRHGDAEHPHTWIDVPDQGPSARRCSCGAVIGTFWADTPFITGEFPVENIVAGYYVVHRSFCTANTAVWAGCICGRRGRERLQIEEAARIATRNILRPGRGGPQ